MVKYRAMTTTTYELDPVHSHLGFSVRHMMVSHQRGRFQGVTGTLTLDRENLTKSHVEVAIDTATLDTHNTDRDNHLRSADFFDVEKFPEITFKSNRIEKNGDSYILRGPLTMHGISKEVAIPFSISGTVKDPRGGTHLGAEASLTISRKDFGLTWNRTLEGGGVLVSDEVKIELGVEATRQ
jgi:polyisoprenoid-binding protein YceI